MAFAWDLNGDGTYDDTGVSATHTFTTVGDVSWSGSR